MPIYLIFIFLALCAQLWLLRSHINGALRFLSQAPTEQQPRSLSARLFYRHGKGILPVGYYIYYYFVLAEVPAVAVAAVVGLIIGFEGLLYGLLVASVALTLPTLALDFLVRTPGRMENDYGALLWKYQKGGKEATPADRKKRKKHLIFTLCMMALLVLLIAGMTVAPFFLR